MQASKTAFYLLQLSRVCSWETHGDFLDKNSGAKYVKILKSTIKMQCWITKRNLHIALGKNSKHGHKTNTTNLDAYSVDLDIC